MDVSKALDLAKGYRTHLATTIGVLTLLASLAGLLPGETAAKVAGLFGLLAVTFSRFAQSDVANKLDDLLHGEHRDDSDPPPPSIPFRAAAVLICLGLVMSPEITSAQEVTRQRVCDGRRCYWVDVPGAHAARLTEAPAKLLPKAPAMDYPPQETSMRLSTETRGWFRNPDGSCVQCSIGMAGVHGNDPNAASLLWDSDYGAAERGGSWPSRVESYCDRRGIKAWSVTGSSVDETLPWCAWAAKTGRFAAIGAGRAHFQTLYGYDPHSREWMVCNNNSTNHIDRYDHESFRQLHAASGPWVVVLEKASSDPPRPVAWWK